MESLVAPLLPKIPNHATITSGYLSHTHQEGTSMKKSTIISIAFICVMLAIGAIAVINRANQKPPEVDLTPHGFSQTSITIQAGDTVHFVNPSTGVTQMLCLGEDKICSRYAFDPPALKGPGLRIAPGQAADVVFTLEGTYNVTSTTMPGMNLTITVEPDD
jgi:plastocyanin